MSELIKYRALKKVMLEGEFKVEGKAIQVVAALFKWFDDQEKLFTEAKEQPVIKPLGPPVPITPAKGKKK